MTKLCICQICSCGRHKCPHNPRSTFPKGDSPCNLTQYNQTYTAHPLTQTSNFKPAQQPLQGGRFDDHTTQRTDYDKKPLSKPHVHRPDVYQQPQGEIDTNTSYNQDYQRKQGRPAQAIRHEPAKQVSAKFEAEPTYRSDYPKWDVAGRPLGYGQQAAWQPPNVRFEGESTQKHDFQKYDAQRRAPFKPSEAANLSKAPFENSTSHKDAFIAHPIPEKYMRAKEVYNPTKAPLEGQSTMARDYQGAPGGPMRSFKPTAEALHSDVPFADDTTQRSDFTKKPIEKRPMHSYEVYQKPQGHMETDTINNLTYRAHPIVRQMPVRPRSVNKASGAFDGTTNYNSDFKKWQANPVRAIKPEEYVPNHAQFEGATTYANTFTPHDMARVKSYRPDNRAMQSDARFEDETMYKHDYQQKPLNICEAAYIDQPTSRYRFKERDGEGHRFYSPITTTISALPKSPMQAQPKLQALSMA